MDYNKGPVQLSEWNVLVPAVQWAVSAWVKQLWSNLFLCSLLFSLSLQKNSGTLPPLFHLSPPLFTPLLSSFSITPEQQTKLPSLLPSCHLSLSLQCLYQRHSGNVKPVIVLAVCVSPRVAFCVVFCPYFMCHFDILIRGLQVFIAWCVNVCVRWSSQIVTVAWMPHSDNTWALIRLLLVSESQK